MSAVTDAQQRVREADERLGWLIALSPMVVDDMPSGVARDALIEARDARTARQIALNEKAASR